MRLVSFQVLMSSGNYRNIHAQRTNRQLCIIIHTVIQTDLGIWDGVVSLLTGDLDGATAPASFFASLPGAFAANMQESLP